MNRNIVVGINLGDFGSTGTIMRNALEYANSHGNFDYLVFVPKSNGKPNTFAYFERNTLFDKFDRRFFHKSLGNPDGFFEYRATKRIINKIKWLSKRYDNIIIHLHNLHMAYIDFRLLFPFLAKCRKVNKIFYTIHDSWPYTGGCYSYTFVGCDKWKKGCKGICPEAIGNKKYSPSIMLLEKYKKTQMLKNKITLLPVSQWISKEIDQSILRDLNKIVIYGETNIKAQDSKDVTLLSNLKLDNKKVILSISAYWDPWKGAKYLYEIASKLPSDYVILVVGGKFDTSQFTNIVHVGTVPNELLPRYYSIADVYVSTSQSESLGLTTCEAQICGVPVVAFGHAGVKETFNSKTGVLVGEDNDVNKMVEAIRFVVESKPFLKTDIINNGLKFKKYSSSKKYFSLYCKSLEESA